MPRSKVRLEWMRSNSARKATFEKRTKGLMKKVKELSVLTDASACAIIYGGDNRIPPETWSSSQQEVREVLEKYNSIPDIEKSKKTENTISIYEQKVKKGKQKLKATNLLMEQIYYNGKSLRDINNTFDLNSLKYMIEQKEKQFERQIYLLTRNHQNNDVGPLSFTISLPRLVLNPNTATYTNPSINNPPLHFNDYSPPTAIHYSFGDVMNNPPLHSLTHLLNHPFNNLISNEVLGRFTYNTGLGSGDHVNVASLQMQQENQSLYSSLKYTNLGNVGFGEQPPYYMSAGNNTMDNLGFGNQMNDPSAQMQPLQGGQSISLPLFDHEMNTHSHQMQMQMPGRGEMSYSMAENNNVGYGDHANNLVPNQIQMSHQQGGRSFNIHSVSGNRVF